MADKRNRRLRSLRYEMSRHFKICFGTESGREVLKFIKSAYDAGIAPPMDETSMVFHAGRRDLAKSILDRVNADDLGVIHEAFHLDISDE